MKTIVSLLDLSETDIKPSGEAQRFHELLEADVRARWGNASTLAEVECPACGSDGHRLAFERFGLPYAECTGCGTLYVRRRPTDAMIQDYYATAASARYWREEILAHTADARREKVVRPRAEWVADSIAELAPDAGVLLDLSTNGDFFREELAALATGIEVRAAPMHAASLAGAGSVDVVTAFDVFDRAGDLSGLVDRIGRALKPGGILFLTAPAGSGFEIQVLWDASPTPIPPDKINLLTAKGFFARFAEPEWEIVEFSTPGILDVETVKRAVERDPGREWPRFVSRLATESSTRTLADFVEFLQSNRLASFARLAIRKGGGAR